MEEKAPKALSIDEQLALIASVFFVLQGPIRRIPNIGSRYRGGKGRTDTFGKVSRQIEKKLRSLQFSISKTENHSILLNAILNSLKQKATEFAFLCDLEVEYSNNFKKNRGCFSAILFSNIGEKRVNRLVSKIIDEIDPKQSTYVKRNIRKNLKDWSSKKGSPEDAVKLVLELEKFKDRVYAKK
jgi:hypothetical protein